MQTARVSRIGGPEVLEIVVSDAPVPKPGEVLVEVEAAGINYVDVYHQRQGYVEMPKPHTPGLEGVGIVRAVAPGTSTLKAGRRVAWINVLGSYAEQIALPASQAIVILDSQHSGRLASRGQGSTLRTGRCRRLPSSNRKPDHQGKLVLILQG